MLRLADRIDQFSTAAGRAMAWLVLVVLVVQFAVVVLRYVFGLGSIWLQESIVYAHAFAWIDLLGTLFLLLPMAVLILSLSLPYAARAWVIFERSQEISGLPSVFLLKTAIPIAAAMLIMQGCAQILRAAVLLERPRPRTRKR
jgi:TRAP-type mannitol/chloroaromatic compound transport system permease small subunit